MIKYRPSLTLDEIQFILTHSHISTQPELAAKLTAFILKASHGIIKPSHIKSGTRTTTTSAESLGFSTTQPASNQIESLLDLYHTNPSFLSPTQLDQINHHRYINDMMTPDEESEYERNT